MSKRDAIIQATIETVADNGFAGTPTILISRQAGTAENTIFRLFGNKTELMHTVFEETLSRFQEYSQAPVEGQQGIEPTMMVLMHQLVLYYRKKPEELAYILQYVNSTIGVSRRPDIRYENGEDMAAYPLIHILHSGKEARVFKSLSMPALVSLSLLPLMVYLREEQIRGVNHSEQEWQLLMSACLEGIKA